MPKTFDPNSPAELINPRTPVDIPAPMPSPEIEYMMGTIKSYVIKIVNTELIP